MSTPNLPVTSVNNNAQMQGTPIPVAHDGSRMKIHNADLFVECMQSADWSSPGRSKRGVRQLNAKEARKEESAKKLGLTNARNLRHKEAFLEKQALRENEYRQKVEVARKETERKHKEFRDRKEKEFHESVEEFARVNRELVDEAQEAITADEMWRQRKRERLYNEWSLKVFQPMQDQINNQLASMTQEELEMRRRQMFQSFLDESNKKTNGLFRDIVIESDYDPVRQMKDASVRYQPVSMADDPTKNRGMRELHDNRTRGLINHLMGTTGKKPVFASEGKRTAVDVEQWSHMEATPYGRYSSEDDDPRRRRNKPNFNKSSVKMDHYDVPSGDAGRELLKQENGIRGVKTLKPIQAPEKERRGLPRI